MKTIAKIFGIILLAVVLLWIGMTLWVQKKGKSVYSSFGEAEAERHALIVYDPDPLYNLDEQICKEFAKGLVDSGDWQAIVASVARAERLGEEADLFVFCANTYNWAPDKAIVSYINGLNSLSDKQVVSITLGSGSTARAQRLLDELLVQKGGEIVRSQSLWLMRPNDEDRIEESNVEVAGELAQELGKEVAGNY